MSKRKFDPLPGTSKKIRTVPLSYALKLENKQDEGDLFESTICLSLPNNTEITLLDYRRKFPCEKLQHKYPPIVFIHQLFYSNLDNALIHSDIAKLEDSKLIKTFSIGRNLPNAIIFMEDFKNCISKTYSPNTRVKHFIKEILPTLRGTEVLKTNLQSYRNVDITELIRFGLLINKSEKFYSLSFPGIGNFIKIFQDGRKEILNALKRSKFGEVFLSELKGMKFKKIVLDIDYHIADLIGAKLVNCKETTSGKVLQLINK